MKAVCIEEFGQPEVLKIKEVKAPVPKRSEVLVKVKAAGVNPVDIHLRQGSFMNLPPLPLILGKEVAGDVEAVGSNVTEFKVGDRVTCCLPRDGGYAEYVTCTESHTLRLPDRLTYSQGAAIYVAYFTAYRALITKAKAKKGETVLIHGASGAVGIAAIQLAKYLGLTITGTAGSEEGIQLIKSIGVDSALPHNEKGYLLRAFATTEGKGFDIILENCADINLGNDLHLLGPNGRVVVIGTKKPTNLHPKSQPSVVVQPRSLIFTEGSIHAVKLIGITPNEFEEYGNFIVSKAEEGVLTPVIAQEFSSEQAHLAHQFFIDNNCHAKGKIVIVFP